ncbi:GH36-type glycosyl hydrolase domain-containing protein [Carnobacterium gallinarum]|uniref:GH36-type glycosyl hydrolase domain-containing protein n=1 Tax=Carnobacterium gallinarum TaxID=2749 RepID=UPI00055833A4|nr:cellobiose phosphorylase [Carnobacterium gallinarum]
MGNTQNYIQLQAGKTAFRFLKSGDIFDITHGETMYNQVQTNILDGSMNNLYLRVFNADGIRYFPLLGIASTSTFYTGSNQNQLKWLGEVAGVSYTVIFSLATEGIWFWSIELSGAGLLVDVIYGQDVGLAGIGALQSNEAYVGQYIDHAVFEDAVKGFVVCSRQNQPQANNQFPYLQQGSLTKAQGYSTDGFQFFGLSYKESNQPAILSQLTLANEVYQYEMAYTALQSGKIQLTEEQPQQIVFYGLAQENHPTALTEIDYQMEVDDAWEQLQLENPPIFSQQPLIKKAAQFGKVLQTEAFTEKDIRRYFPNRQEEEYSENQLLSFFTDGQAHVVLKEKEQLVERPHGHILFSGAHLKINEEILTTTSYMYGLFNAQVVLGNTSMNKLMSNARNALNVLKTSGQRIYVELDGKYQLLAMPAAFEMGFNYGKWYYKLQDDMLIVTNYTTVDAPKIQLDVVSESGKSYRYLVTNQITMNENEYKVPFKLTREGNLLTVKAEKDSTMAEKYPDLTYYLEVVQADFQLQEDAFFLETDEIDASESLVILEIAATTSFGIKIQGTTTGEAYDATMESFMAAVDRYTQHLGEVMNYFELYHENPEIQREVARLNTLAWWYTHNMLVHYLVPHGLEQYGGAAWGTRDVSQGPVEYFFATNQTEVVKEIIQTLFANQFENDGNWPQWFMFDRYEEVKAEESHGDIIVWPLKVVGDYLKRTNDFSILADQIPYADRETNQKTTYTASLLEHLRKEIDYIRTNFLVGTYLSCYGDGDWDDTLQPYDSNLKKNMASSWTVALTYQVLKQLAEVLQEVVPDLAEELTHLVAGIEKDFKKYMLATDVIPGFVYMENPTEVELMIHPTDTKTGIQYRLLPMTRSMIGELLTPEEADAHYQVIQKELYHPDGVRLMNRPATYHGGVSTNFKRGEQAANFGREVGLQYVHAHIRFIEAMAKLGKGDEVWRGLSIVNPVQIRDVVPNAKFRQSNAYFSSSDGDFRDRYQAQERFGQLKTGEVAVKGGWRIYSSGPGIYMNQLISNGLGIRQDATHVIFDPIMTTEMDGLIFHYHLLGQPVEIHYHVNEQVQRKVQINGIEIPVELGKNRYREGASMIEHNLVEAALKQGNRIDIYV